MKIAEPGHDAALLPLVGVTYRACATRCVHTVLGGEAYSELRFFAAFSTSLTEYLVPCLRRLVLSLLRLATIAQGGCFPLPRRQNREVCELSQRVFHRRSCRRAPAIGSTPQWHHKYRMKATDHSLQNHVLRVCIRFSEFQNKIRDA